MGSHLYREQLCRHIEGGKAFMPLDEMLKKINYEKLGTRPANLPYSFYELFYHCWYAQRDLLEYMISSTYKAPHWPNDYWPQQPEPESEGAWNRLRTSFKEDRQEIKDLILNPEKDLLDPVPSNPEHNILRGVLLVIEHTAYHTGQMLIVLRHLGLHSS